MKNWMLVLTSLLLMFAVSACSAAQVEHGEVLVYAAPT